MSIPWRPSDRKKLDAALRKYPAESGLCAALARAVLSVAKPMDRSTAGLQVRPRGSARFILTKHPAVHVWHSHTLVRTQAHHLDALTGVDGCRQEEYLEMHWSYSDALEIVEVDVMAVDPGVQHDGE